MTSRLTSSIVLCLSLTGAFLAMAAPSVPPIPVLTAERFDQGFEEAYLSNGFIGIRPGPNPLKPCLTLVSGYVMDCAWEDFENAAAAPYPFESELLVNGQSILTDAEALQTLSQTLDMSNGELATEMLYDIDGSPVTIKVLQFMPRTLPAAACMRVTVQPQSAAQVAFRPLADEGRHEARNSLGVALKRYGPETVECEAGERVTFDLVAGLLSSHYHPEPHLQARRVVGWADMVGFDQLREDNREAWRELWRGRIKAVGSPRDQLGLDSAFFYVMSSASPYSLTGIAPYAYSHQHAYFGHGFWDMDHWVYHATLPLQPKAARAMMEYRFNNIEMARKKAMTFGFDGLMFSWEASVLDGSEVTPSTAETGWAEHHIVPAVGLAFWEYYLATGDNAFLENRAWPVLKGVAEWIASRGDFTARGFELRNVMGVDEHVNRVDNNAHFNLMCQLALTGALRVADLTGREAPDRWQRIVNQMRIPVDPQKNVVIPYDGAVVHENAKGYSIGALQFLVFHNPQVGFDLFKRTWQFEEELRAQMAPAPNNPASSGAVGFPAPTIATCAAMFGEPHKAADVFRLSWEKYTLEPFMLSKEYQGHTDGNFVTNQGAQLQAALYGFTGLRLNEDDWRVFPARLPEGWERIEIDRIYVKGQPMRLIAVDGKKARLIPLD